MAELVAAFGLVLVLEGALYALAPDAVKRFANVLITCPSSRLRSAGLIAAAAGVVVVWLARG